MTTRLNGARASIPDGTPAEPSDAASDTGAFAERMQTVLRVIEGGEDKGSAEPPKEGGPSDPGADATGVIDSAAYGRGEQVYLFVDIQRAITERALAKIQKIMDARGAVKDHRTAVRWLIAEGIITEEEARKPLD
jgi:hypothetical protein